jgi:4-deoxy-L-threo-5-hexosulose-uronate ketol-isomerase
MEIRYPSHPDRVKTFTTDQLRQEFLIQTLFAPDAIHMVYSHVDRVIVGGALPVNAPLKLTGDPKETGTAYFLERRELGIVNIGERGSVTVDGQQFDLTRLDGLYVGMGKQAIEFASADSNQPAEFYLVSAPAHHAYPTAHIPISSAQPSRLGDISNSNQRTIYRYIHPEGAKSCQLVMGVTLLEPNNLWNTMPTHTHVRRMEVYFYFGMDAESVVFHLMGEPHETRHLVIRNQEAVICPSWSIHAGMGTSHYAFIWAMAGENQTFSDMDAVSMADLR